MPELPFLQYSDGGKKAKIVNFGGLTRGAGARDGGIYDGANFSAHDAPALTTRLGFAEIDNIRDEDGESVTLPRIVSAVADGAGEVLLLLSEEELFLYSIPNNTIKRAPLPDGIDADAARLTVPFKREHKTTAPDGTTYEYTYFITLILPARAAFVRSVRVTKDRSGNVTETTEREYFEQLPTREAPRKWTMRSYQDMNISTWFGNDEGSTSSVLPPTPAMPVKLAEGESVVSVTSGELIPPGISATIRKEPKEGEASEKAGLVRELFLLDEREIRLGLNDYSTGSPVHYDTYFSSIVLANDAGFAANTRKKMQDSDYYYYSPEMGAYSVFVDIPENIRGAFIHENRLWAWDEQSIYVSALGAFESFAVDGSDAGGWSAPLVLGEDITAGCSYGGRPVFFTENHIITVYGSYPSTYGLNIQDAHGVAKDSAASLKRCGGYLYYLSRAGVMRYGGNVPVCISRGLTLVELSQGRACADARYYVLYAKYGVHRSIYQESEYRTWTYDTAADAWNRVIHQGSSHYEDQHGHRSGELEPIFAYVSNAALGVSIITFVHNYWYVPTTGGEAEGRARLYCMPSFERQRLLPGAYERVAYYGYNDSYGCFARMGRFFCSSPNVKGLKRIQLRARLISQPRAGGAWLGVRICYDDADASLIDRDRNDATGWELIYSTGTIYTESESEIEGDIYKTRNIDIPLIPRRFDNFKLEIFCVERWTIDNLSFEYEMSSERR